MSDTYKTKPSWVKINKPEHSYEVRERHDHRHGICDIDEAKGSKRPFYWQIRGRYCGYDVSYYSWNGGFYARPPYGRVYRHEYEGRMRAGWRKARQDMLKLSREDVEDYDVKSYQHRHSALWEMY